MNLAPGIDLFASDPLTYQMTYLNGTFSYTERFALVRVGGDYVTAAGMAIGAALTQVEIDLAIAGGVAGVVVAAIEKVVGFAVHLLLEDDGSILLAFANHYCGCRRGGIDITALGVPYDWWSGVVNGLLTAAGAPILNEAGGPISKAFQVSNARTDAVRP